MTVVLELVWLFIAPTGYTNVTRSFYRKGEKRSINLGTFQIHQ